jgi:dipeptidase D
MKVEHEKTKEILKWFEEVTKIPRCSKHEEKICKWLMNWAKESGFENKMDPVGNVLIRVPASPGNEKSPIVVIQGHVDMVCEKTPDSDHDFAKDPIKLKYEGEWLTADKTTLGADNGIAIAMAIVLALDKKIKHGPLELLFTVDEETGLTGANALKPGFIKGKVLINVDSEDEGYFTVGCAGGLNTYLSLPLHFKKKNPKHKPFKLKAGGMKGGHSGIDINAQKANAIRVLGRALYQVNGKVKISVADIKGGSAHNAIPRDAEAVIFFDPVNLKKVKKVITDLEKILKIEFANTDPGIELNLEKAKEADFKQVLSEADTRKIIEFILIVPHGVEAMSKDIENLVETSNNFANIKIEKNKLQVLTSQRSSRISRLEELTQRIESVAFIAGGRGKSADGYPPWQPNMESSLLKKSTDLYKKLYKKEPVVEVIHAGLECGIIGDKNPGMDMISIGPTLKFPHSPDEKIHVGSIGKVWDFLVALLKELS